MTGQTAAEIVYNSLIGHQIDHRRPCPHAVENKIILAALRSDLSHQAVPPIVDLGSGEIAVHPFGSFHRDRAQPQPNTISVEHAPPLNTP